MSKASRARKAAKHDAKSGSEPVEAIGEADELTAELPEEPPADAGSVDDGGAEPTE